VWVPEKTPGPFRKLWPVPPAFASSGIVPAGSRGTRGKWRGVPGAPLAGHRATGGGARSLNRTGDGRSGIGLRALGPDPVSVGSGPSERWVPTQRALGPYPTGVGSGPSERWVPTQPALGPDPVSVGSLPSERWVPTQPALGPDPVGVGSLPNRRWVPTQAQQGPERPVERRSPRKISIVTGATRGELRIGDRDRAPGDPGSYVGGPATERSAAGSAAAACSVDRDGPRADLQPRTSTQALQRSRGETARRGDGCTGRRGGKKTLLSLSPPRLPASL